MVDGEKRTRLWLAAEVVVDIDVVTVREEDGKESVLDVGVGMFVGKEATGELRTGRRNRMMRVRSGCAAPRAVSSRSR